MKKDFSPGKLLILFIPWAMASLFSSSPQASVFDSLVGVIFYFRDDAYRQNTPLTQ